MSLAGETCSARLPEEEPASLESARKFGMLEICLSSLLS